MVAADSWARALLMCNTVVYGVTINVDVREHDDSTSPSLTLTVRLTVTVPGNAPADGQPATPNLGLRLGVSGD